MSDVFFNEIEKLGHLIGKNQFRLVYGGANCGLMGRVADSALKVGGQVLGIMPEVFADKEVTHSGLSQLEKVPDFFARKKAMLESSDAFIVFPGGIGTLDEAIEMICYRQINIHEKPIIFVNLFGFWDRFFDMMFEIRQQKMIGEPLNHYYDVVNNSAQAIDVLKKEWELL